MRHTVPLTHGFITYRVRGTMFIVCGIDEFVRDGFDGIVAVVEGEPPVEGGLLEGVHASRGARGLAHRQCRRNVGHQPSDVRVAFILSLPSIDVRMVLGQLQMRQERPVLADDMLTIFAVNPPRF